MSGNTRRTGVRGPCRPESALRGFTLIEALVAIGLVAVVLPVALEGVAHATRAAELARRHDVALRLASSRLARLVADGSWAGSAGSGDCDPAQDGDDAAGYRWQVTVTSWRDPSVHGLRVSVGRSPDDPAAVALETLVTAGAGSP